MPATPANDKPAHYAKRVGKTTATVYLTSEEHEILTAAASAEDRSLTEFLRRSGLAAAKKISGKIPKET